MSTDTQIRVPDQWRQRYAEAIAEKLIEAGWSAAQTTTATAAATERLITTLEAGLNRKASNLRNGEGFSIDWEVIANLGEIEVSKPGQAPDAAALLKTLKALQGPAAQPVAAKAIATVPVAAKADTTAGMTPDQLAQLIGAVASAAAQGAATGAQQKQDTTLEVEVQDIPTPGQLGRRKQRISTRRVANSLPDLR